MILKRLAGDRAAYSKQMEAYGKHLSRQYQDRVVYWRSRTASRLQSLPSGLQSIVCIVDSMDHSKYRWPRSNAMVSKEFASFNRPHLDVTGLLLHGHGAFLAASEGWVAKEASWTIDLVAHATHLLSANVDLRSAELIIQADNCTKEVKNNSFCRYLSLLVATRRLRRAELRFLQTGHSHEDIDAFFGQLTSYLEGQREIETPPDMIDALQRFLDRPECRPNEPLKKAFKVDQVRDWWLGFF